MLAHCIANGGKRVLGGPGSHSEDDCAESSQDYMAPSLARPETESPPMPEELEEEFFSLPSDDDNTGGHHDTIPLSTAHQYDGPPSPRSPRFVVKINERKDLEEYTRYDCEEIEAFDSITGTQARQPTIQTPTKRCQSAPTPVREDLRTIAETPDSELRKEARARSIPKKPSSTPKKKKAAPEEDAPVPLAGSSRLQDKEADENESTADAHDRSSLKEEAYIPASPLGECGSTGKLGVAKPSSEAASSGETPRPGAQPGLTSLVTSWPAEREALPEKRNPVRRLQSISVESRPSYGSHTNRLAKPSLHSAKTKQPDLPFVKLKASASSDDHKAPSVLHTKQPVVSSRPTGKALPSKKQTTLPFTLSQSSSLDEDDCRIVGVSPRIKNETQVKQPNFHDGFPTYDTISDSSESPTTSQQTQRLRIKSRSKPRLLIKEEPSKSAASSSPQKTPVVLDLTLLSSSGESEFDSDEYDFDAISKLIESSPPNRTAEKHSQGNKTAASIPSTSPKSVADITAATWRHQSRPGDMDKEKEQADATKEAVCEDALSHGPPEAGSHAPARTKDIVRVDRKPGATRALPRVKRNVHTPKDFITEHDVPECHGGESSQILQPTAPFPCDRNISASSEASIQKPVTHVLRPAYGHKVPFPKYDPTGRTGRYQPHHRAELDFKGILKPSGWCKAKSRQARSENAGQQDERGRVPSSGSFQKDSSVGAQDTGEVLDDSLGTQLPTQHEAANDTTSSPNPPQTPDRAFPHERTIRHNPRHGYGSNASPLRVKTPCQHREVKEQPPMPLELSTYSQLLKRAKEATPAYKTQKAMKPTIDRLKKRIIEGDEPSTRQYLGPKDYRAVEAEMVRRGLNKAQQDTFLAELVTEYSRVLAGSTVCLKSMWLKVMDDLYEECSELGPSSPPRTPSKRPKEETKPMSSFEALLAHGQGCTDDSSVSSDCSDSESDCRPPPLTREIQESRGLITPDTSPRRKPQATTSPSTAYSKKRSRETIDAPCTAPKPFKSPKRIKMLSKVVRAVMRRKLALGRVNGENVASTTKQMVDFHSEDWKKRLIDMAGADREDGELSEKAKKRRKLDRGWHKVISKMMSK